MQPVIMQGLLLLPVLCAYAVGWDRDFVKDRELDVQKASASVVAAQSQLANITKKADAAAEELKIIRAEERKLDIAHRTMKNTPAMTVMRVAKRSGIVKQGGGQPNDS